MAALNEALDGDAGVVQRKSVWKWSDLSHTSRKTEKVNMGLLLGSFVASEVESCEPYKAIPVGPVFLVGVLVTPAAQRQRSVPVTGHLAMLQDSNSSIFCLLLYLKTASEIYLCERLLSLRSFGISSCLDLSSSPLNLALASFV